MELGWSALALICLAAAGAWFLQDSLAAREAANAAALEACERLGLQFLDGTVAFAKLSLTRERGRLSLRRTYVFDYTANSIERRQGFVLMTGRSVHSVGYAQDESVRPPQVAQTTAERPSPAGDVLHVAHWRARIGRGPKSPGEREQGRHGPPHP
jgi:hypothetical protein